MTLHPLATQNVNLSPLQGLFKMDQLAFVARNDSDERTIKKFLRLDNADWVEDEVVAQGYVRGAGHPCTNKAKLLFNYDLGIEVEILRYLEGDNYVDRTGIPSCMLAHIGLHLEKGQRMPDALDNLVFTAPHAQQVWTVSHTTDFLVSTGRRYKYTIYDTRALLGVHLKVIERIEPGELDHA